MNKKISHLCITFLLVLTFLCTAPYVKSLAGDNASVAYADVSKNELVFKYIAPKSQTSYKNIFSSTNSVKSIKKSGNSLKATGGRVTAVGTVITPFSTKIGSVVSASGGTIYLVGDYQVRSVSTVNKNAKHVVKVDFKWTYTNSYPLKAKVRITQYFTYKGKVVGKKSVTTQNRSFSYGERW